MFNSPVLSIIISIVFIFFVFSMMASLIFEYVVMLAKKRGKFLADALSQLLRDEFINQVDFGMLIYSHPLISGLKEKSDALPSYIPADVFATALIDSVIDFTTEYSFADQGDPKIQTVPLMHIDPGVKYDQYSRFINATNKLRDSGLKKTFQTFVINTDNYEQLKNNIIVWYEHYMDRIKGWYKKYTAGKMAWIAWGIVIFFNIDTINVFQTLRTNTALSNAISSSAQTYVAANQNVRVDSVTKQQVQGVMALSDSLHFPIGYEVKGNTKTLSLWELIVSAVHKLSVQAKSDGSWIILLLGWFLSAMAIAKGAPFWFDILCRFVNVRQAGAKPVETMKKEKA